MISVTEVSDSPPAPITTVQINRIYIKATPQAVWDAITKPEWTEKYDLKTLLKTGSSLSVPRRRRSLTGQVLRGPTLRRVPRRAATELIMARRQAV